MSFRAWHRFPWLPFVSVALAAVAQAPEEWWPLLFVTLIVQAGWFGTERICYLRAFRGKTIAAPELWRVTRAFIVRYVVLGMVAAIPLVAILLGVFIFDVLTDLPSERWLVGFLVGLYAVFVVVDVALTFVTPALAFTTRRVSRALALGLKMIRSEWPSCAWYVLVPPLAALLVAQTLTRLAGIGIIGKVGTSALATLLNLSFKGATAAFYLRRHEVSDNGAAFAAGDDKSRSTAGHEDGLFLREDEAEDLGRIRDLGAIFAGIERVIPEDGILYLEGTTIAPDVLELLERNQTLKPVPVAKGTIWPKPKMFHIPATRANLQRLAAMERHHAAPEVCDHLVVYRGPEVLLTAYDAGYGSVFVSKRIPKAQIDEFRALLRR